MKKEINTLVSSGGGIRAVTFIGVFKKLNELIEKKKENPEDETIPVINIKTIGSVSAGSIFSLFYLLKYTTQEMEDIILHTNMDQLKDVRFVNFLNKYGIDSGNNIISWIESYMTKKNVNKNITFSELYNLTNVDYQVFATNLNKYKFTRFNHTDTPKLKVIDAIRMSISIPFMFTINHFNLNTLKMGSGDIHVDGGLIDSYPIYLFKDNLENTLGLKLISNGELSEHVVDESIDDIESYIYHILACFIVQKDRKITLNKNYRDHTIFIDTKNITQTINFGLTSDEKKRLIDIGYEQCDQFFKKK